jgi:hypothetical protein
MFCMCGVLVFLFLQSSFETRFVIVFVSIKKSYRFGCFHAHDNIWGVKLLNATMSFITIPKDLLIHAPI